MHKWIALASVVVLAAFIGIAQADEDAKTLFNDKCPISGQNVNPEKTSDYKVEFCCNNCKGKFDKEPAKYLDKAAESEPGKCIFNGRDATVSSTLTIGFCCDNCKRKFDKTPNFYIAKVKPTETEQE